MPRCARNWTDPAPRWGLGSLNLRIPAAPTQNCVEWPGRRYPSRWACRYAMRWATVAGMTTRSGKVRFRTAVLLACGLRQQVGLRGAALIEVDNDRGTTGTAATGPMHAAVEPSCCWPAPPGCRCWWRHGGEVTFERVLQRMAATVAGG